MARGGGGVGDGRRVGARIGGGTRLVAPAMIVGRASRGRAGAAARPPRRASPRAGGHPRGRKKNKRENQKRGPNLTGPGPRTGRVLTRPRRSSRSGRCLWPGAPPACRTRTFRLTTSVPTRSHARSTDPSSNQKESVRPFAQRSSRLKFRAPRPDRRARSCRDASVSVNPPRVRLYVKGCGMSEAELGRIPKVVRGALPRKAGGVPTRGGSNIQ